MLDAVKGAFQVMSGVGEVTLAKAREAAAGLVTQGLAGDAGAVVGGVSELADELWTTGKDNREMLLQLVRMEVDRAVNRMGFVREDELASVRRHVDRLESELARAQEELARAREDAATTSIVAAADTSATAVTDADLAASVVDSARRIAAVTGALGAVPGLAGGPWARVARDLATSAAGIVAAAASAPSGTTGAVRPPVKPVKESAAKPVKESAVKPARKTAAKPAKKPAAKPARKTAANPAKKTATKSARKTATKKTAPKSGGSVDAGTES